MPQCLSPQFESKSPAIVELFSGSAVQSKCTGPVDTLAELELPCALFGKLDHESSRLLSVNKPHLSSTELYLKSELDDFVYLEFFVDTIKPEYASLSSTNVTFTNCVNNFKLTNGTSVGVCAFV